MTSKATSGGTYYVLRSRVSPGLYKPGISNNSGRRHSEHGAEHWETVATFHLGPMNARTLEKRILRQFNHRRIGPHPEERMQLTDQELAQLLEIAKGTESRLQEIRARHAPARHAQLQIDPDAPPVELDPYEPPPAAAAPMPDKSNGWERAIGIAAVTALAVGLGMHLLLVVFFSPVLMVLGAGLAECAAGVFRP
jgi:hypothetical protein